MFFHQQNQTMDILSPETACALEQRWQATARHRLWRGFSAGRLIHEKHERHEKEDCAFVFFVDPLPLAESLGRKIQPPALRATKGGVALSLPAAVHGCDPPRFSFAPFAVSFSMRAPDQRRLFLARAPRTAEHPRGWNAPARLNSTRK